MEQGMPKLEPFLVWFLRMHLKKCYNFSRTPQWCVCVLLSGTYTYSSVVRILSGTYPFEDVPHLQLLSWIVFMQSGGCYTLSHVPQWDALSWWYTTLAIIVSIYASCSWSATPPVLLLRDTHMKEFYTFDQFLSWSCAHVVLRVSNFQPSSFVTCIEGMLYLQPLFSDWQMLLFYAVSKAIVSLEMCCAGRSNKVQAFTKLSRRKWISVFTIKYRLSYTSRAKEASTPF